MTTSTNTNVNAGILAMRAANERKAQAKAAAKAAAALAAPAASTPPVAAPAQPAAPATPTSAPMPNRVWHVTLVLEREGKRGLWACRDVSAPAIKRAIKGARERFASLHKDKGALIVGTASVVERDAAQLPTMQL